MSTTDTTVIPEIILQHTDRSTKLRDVFTERFKTKPEFYIRVPGRVNLIGEHIDYCGYGVCPMALEQDILLAVSTVKETYIHLHNLDKNFNDFSGDIKKIEISVGDSAPMWHQYFLCGVKGVLEVLPKDIAIKGIQVAVSGCIPQSAGLSSSSALVSAAALATSRAFKYLMTKNKIASLCAECERYIGTQGGGMDQAIAFLATEGDTLKIFLDLTFSSYFNKFNRKISYFVIMSLATNHLIHACLALFSDKYPIKITYLPFYAGGLHVINNYVHLNLFATYLDKFNSILFPKLKQWNSGSKSLHKKILREVKFAKVIAFIGIFIAMMTAFLMVYPKSYEEMKRTIGENLLYNYEKTHYITGYIRILFGFLYMHILFIAISPSFLIMYYFYHIIFQSYLLCESIKNISYCRIGLDSHYNQQYQAMISKRITECIFHHRIIKQLQKTVKYLIRKLILLQVIMGIFVGTSCLVFFFANNNLSNNVPVISVGMVIVTSTVNFSLIGQKVCDESEQIRKSLMDCPWYLWNETNKYLYKIFLINASSGLKFDGYNLIGMDKKLIINISRQIISFATVIYQTRSK